MDIRACSAVSAILVLCSQSAWSGGFYITELGTPGSLGTAGSANPTNTLTADSAWTNPAAMTGVEQDHGLVGVQAIIPVNKFDSSIAEGGGGDGGNAGFISAVPSHFLTTHLTEDISVGFSVVGMMGGGLDYGKNFVGRYGAYRAVLAGLAFSPSVGYKINDDFSVGMGVSVVQTTFDEDIAVRQPGFSDGRVSINQIDDWGITTFYGLTYQATEKLMVGVVYRPEWDVDLEGDVSFANFVGVTPTADEVEVEWDNPQLLQVGFRYALNDMYTLFMDADWEDWSEFSDNTLSFEGGLINPIVKLDRNWKDTYHVGFGVLRKWGDHRVSTGIAYDSSPVNDSDRTIDLPVDEQLKLAAAYGWKGDSLDFAFGATFMYLGEGEVDQTAQGVRFKGEFDTNYVVFAGGTLLYEF